MTVISKLKPRERIDTSKYDFLDLGCKKGGSIAWCQKKYGGKGLGVDLDPEWVKEATQNGFDVICQDILTLDFPKNSFRYVAMMDFLEHLPDRDSVKKVLAKCKKWARDFFFIHHPSFEDKEYLKKYKLKIDWTDGYNHTCPLTVNDFEEIFKELGITNYKIEQQKQIIDSKDPHIIPIDAPFDTHLYSEELGPKPNIKFEKPVYARIEIMVSL